MGWCRRPGHAVRGCAEARCIQGRTGVLQTGGAGTGRRAAEGAGRAPRSSACDSACSCACDSESRCGRRASTSESRSSSCTCTGPSRSGSAPTIACARARARWPLSACSGRPGTRRGSPPMSTLLLASATYQNVTHWKNNRLPCNHSQAAPPPKQAGSATTPFMILGNGLRPKQAAARTAAWERAARRACSACTSVGDRPVRIIGSTSAAAYGRHAPRSATASTPTHCAATPQRGRRRAARAAARPRR